MTLVSESRDPGGHKWEPTFLSVASEDPLTFSGDDVPDTHVGIVASRNKRSSPGGESTHRMLMPFQMKFVVRVLVYVLLRKNDVSQRVVDG